MLGVPRFQKTSWRAGTSPRPRKAIDSVTPSHATAVGSPPTACAYGRDSASIIAGRGVYVPSGSGSNRPQPPGVGSFHSHHVVDAPVASKSSSAWPIHAGPCVVAEPRPYSVTMSGVPQASASSRAPLIDPESSAGYEPSASALESPKIAV